jgi:hypothetical protein
VLPLARFRCPGPAPGKWQKIKYRVENDGDACSSHHRPFNWGTNAATIYKRIVWSVSAKYTIKTVDASWRGGIGRRLHPDSLETSSSGDDVISHIIIIVMLLIRSAMLICDVDVVCAQVSRKKETNENGWSFHPWSKTRDTCHQRYKMRREAL